MDMRERWQAERLHKEWKLYFTEHATHNLPSLVALELLLRYIDYLRESKVRNPTIHVPSVALGLFFGFIILLALLLISGYAH